MPPLPQGLLQARTKGAYKQQTNSCQRELAQSPYQLKGVALGILLCTNKLNKTFQLGNAVKYRSIMEDLEVYGPMPNWMNG